MNTIRERCYDAKGKEVVARINLARSLIEKRRDELWTWTSESLRNQEETQINELDELVRWLQFGGPQPFWMTIERELSEDETFEVLT